MCLEEAIQNSKSLILMVVDNKETDHIDALITSVMPLSVYEHTKQPNQSWYQLEGSRCSEDRQ